MTGKHAFLSASGTPAWMRCHAKPWREKDLPNYDSIYAIEGTEAHSLLEYLLSVKGVVSEKAQDHPAFIYTMETVRLIDSIARVEKANNDYDVQVYPEQKLNIEFITTEKGAKGTADVVIVGKDVLTIIDLKYGKGIRVDAQDNEQLLIYGAAAMRKFGKGKKSLSMIISQPRMNHISQWILTRKEMNVKIDVIRQVAKNILNAKGGDHLPATPGATQCQFCKLKATCEERAVWLKVNPPKSRKRIVEDVIFTNLDDEEYIEAAIGLSVEENK